MTASNKLNAHICAETVSDIIGRKPFGNILEKNPAEGRMIE